MPQFKVEFTPHPHPHPHQETTITTSPTPNSNPFYIPESISDIELEQTFEKWLETLDREESTKETLRLLGREFKIQILRKQFETSLSDAGLIVNHGSPDIPGSNPNKPLSPAQAQSHIFSPRPTPAPRQFPPSSTTPQPIPESSPQPSSPSLGAEANIFEESIFPSTSSPISTSPSNSPIIPQKKIRSRSQSTTAPFTPSDRQSGIFYKLSKAKILFSTHFSRRRQHPPSSTNHTSSETGTTRIPNTQPTHSTLGNSQPSSHSDGHQSPRSSGTLTPSSQRSISPPLYSFSASSSTPIFNTPLEDPLLSPRRPGVVLSPTESPQSTQRSLSRNSRESNDSQTSRSPRSFKTHIKEFAAKSHTLGRSFLRKSSFEISESPEPPIPSPRLTPGQKPKAVIDAHIFSPRPPVGSSSHSTKKAPAPQYPSIYSQSVPDPNDTTISQLFIRILSARVNPGLEEVGFTLSSSDNQHMSPIAPIGVRPQVLQSLSPLTPDFSSSKNKNKSNSPGSQTPQQSMELFDSIYSYPDGTEDLLASLDELEQNLNSSNTVTNSSLEPVLRSPTTSTTSTTSTAPENSTSTTLVNNNIPNNSTTVAIPKILGIPDNSSKWDTMGGFIDLSLKGQLKTRRFRRNPKNAMQTSIQIGRNPFWGEDFLFAVNQPFGQLTLKFYAQEGNKKGEKTTLVSQVDLCLWELDHSLHEPIAQWIPMEVPSSDRPRSISSVLAHGINKKSDTGQFLNKDLHSSLERDSIDSSESRDTRDRDSRESLHSKISKSSGKHKSLREHLSFHSGKSTEPVEERNTFLYPESMQVRVLMRYIYSPVWQHIYTARNLYSQGDYQNAHDEIQQALQGKIKRKSATWYICQITLSAIYIHLGKYEESMVVAKRLCNAKPKWHESHYRAALANLHLGRMKEAKIAIKKAHTLVQKSKTVDPELISSISEFQALLDNIDKQTNQTALDSSTTTQHPSIPDALSEENPDLLELTIPKLSKSKPFESKTKGFKQGIVDSDSNSTLVPEKELETTNIELSNKRVVTPDDCLTETGPETEHDNSLNTINIEDEHQSPPTLPSSSPGSPNQFEINPHFFSEPDPNHSPNSPIKALSTSSLPKSDSGTKLSRTDSTSSIASTSSVSRTVSVWVKKWKRRPSYERLMALHDFSYAGLEDE